MNDNRKLFALDGKILPPQGLLFALLVQVPAILWCWPLRPGMTSLSVGSGFVLAGVVLNLCANRLFVRNRIGVCPFSPVGQVIRNGPFRFTRNPMYLGMVLICAGTALATGLYVNLCAAVLLAAWLHFRFVLPEEKFLQEQPGLDYLLYACRTSRWLGLPRARLVPTPESKL